MDTEIFVIFTRNPNRKSMNKKPINKIFESYESAYEHVQKLLSNKKKYNHLLYQ